jgi:ArsR family transcriptional regulator, arsenate/arsenite/antimonite-responsive transcriptional repressor
MAVDMILFQQRNETIMPREPIQIVEFAKILADETRQKIMAICCCNQISVSEIVEQLDVSQPTVSHHLNILKEAGLVHVERQGKHMLYSLRQDLVAQSCCKISEDLAPNQPISLVKPDHP